MLHGIVKICHTGKINGFAKRHACNWLSYITDCLLVRICLPYSYPISRCWTNNWKMYCNTGKINSFSKRLACFSLIVYGRPGLAGVHWTWILYHHVLYSWAKYWSVDIWTCHLGFRCFFLAPAWMSLINNPFTQYSNFNKIPNLNKTHGFIIHNEQNWEQSDRSRFYLVHNKLLSPRRHRDSLIITVFSNRKRSNIVVAERVAKRAIKGFRGNKLSPTYTQLVQGFIYWLI